MRINAGGYGEHTAALDRATGQIYWQSESGDVDEIPEELWESADVVEIPHKRDLGPGHALVFDFTSEHLPDNFGTVKEIFSKRGAYARYKDLLESKGLLQQWYEYDKQGTTAAIRRWCADNDIKLA